MQGGSRSVQRFMVISLALGLAGCSGLRLHDEVRDKRGASAKEAWSKVDTAAVISAERSNLNKLLATELATQDELALAIRDHTLRAIVEAPNIQTGLFARVDEHLEKLVGINAQKNVETAQDLLSRRAAWTARMAERRDVWGSLRTGLAVPTCEELLTPVDAAAQARTADLEAALQPAAQDGPATIKNKILAMSTLEDLKGLCKREPKAEPYSAMGGALRLARQRQLDDLERTAAARRSLMVGKAEYRAAVKAYTDKLSGDPASEAVSAQSVAERLGKAAEALAKAPDALSRQFIAQERIEALNAFVAAVSQVQGGGQLPPESKRATVAFVLFPKLIDDARKSLSDAKAPLALPLLIQRNHDQLQLEATTREVTARETQERLASAVVEVLFEQARQLVFAKRAFDSVAGLPEVQKKSVAAAFSSGSPTAKASLYRGAALYLDALNRLEAQRFKLEYQYIAAEHELQLAYAEVNAKQWSSLLGATVEQVAAASAGGIRSDSVVALLNTMGVLYIGHGVNK